MLIILMYLLSDAIAIFTIVSIIILDIETRKLAKNPIPKLTSKGEENLFGEIVKKGYIHKVYKVEHGK